MYDTLMNNMVKNKNNLNGWIIIDKPLGMSSAKAVGKVKWLLKPAKIGHAGTLDPLASGILPLALGEATKTVNYMMDASKAYSFTVQWGAETETDDKEGKITQTSDNRPTTDEINNILQKFTGEIQQIPPIYSAIKVDGERAYALARGGEEVSLKARAVRVDSLAITQNTPLETTFICHCGKGTYIRSLARDFGRELGCYGHVSVLRRLKVGKFDESQAISLELLEEMMHKGDLGFLLPVESALDDIPALEITPSQAGLLKQGQFLPTPSVSSETVLAMCEGRAVAICSIAHGQMKPVRVFNN